MMTLARTDYAFTVAVGIDDLGLSYYSFYRFIFRVDMNMPVKEVGRLKGFNQPAEGFEAAVDVAVLIVNSKRRAVGKNHIKITTVNKFIPKQPGDHAEDVAPHFILGIQEWAFLIRQGSFKTGKDQIIQHHYPVVQVNCPPGAVKGSALAILHPGIVVPPHVKDRNIIKLE